MRNDFAEIVRRKMAYSGLPFQAVISLVAVGIAVSFGGCGKPSATPDTAANEHSALTTDMPEAAVRKFLEAVRTGNDRVAEAMFTDLARERIKELDIQVAPRGSDTAKFEVSKAELLGDDGARVPCEWTDTDSDGKVRVDKMTWMLRKQPEGWRVAGMAAVVLEGEDPLLLDFEEPKETLQKLERLREEVARRSSTQAEGPPQAGNPPNSEEPIRR